MSSLVLDPKVVPLVSIVSLTVAVAHEFSPLESVNVGIGMEACAYRFLVIFAAVKKLNDLTVGFYFIFELLDVIIW